MNRDYSPNIVYSGIVLPLLLLLLLLLLENERIYSSDMMTSCFGVHVNS